MSSPCHIEMIFEEKEAPVPKPKDDAAAEAKKKKISKKKEARQKAVQRTQE